MPLQGDATKRYKNSIGQRTNTRSIPLNKSYFTCLDQPFEQITSLTCDLCQIITISNYFRIRIQWYQFKSHKLYINKVIIGQSKWNKVILDERNRITNMLIVECSVLALRMLKSKSKEWKCKEILELFTFIHAHVLCMFVNFHEKENSFAP